MIKCPNCEFSIESVFNFCPNCGNNLIEIDNKKGLEESINARKVCSNCGEENQINSTFCNSCGIKLSNSEIKNKSSQTFSKNEFSDGKKVHLKQNESLRTKMGITHSSASAHPSGKRGVESKQFKTNSDLNNQEKVISKNKILLIFISIISVAIIILIASNVLYSPDNNSVLQVENNSQKQKSNIDLSSLNKINEIEENLKSNPGNYDLILEAGHLYMDSGFNEKSIEKYKVYLKKFPKNPDVIVDMGVCFFNLKQYDKADSIMKSALKIEPNHQIAHLNLGIVNLSKGDMQKSKEWFEKTVKINPSSEVGQRAKQLLESH